MIFERYSRNILLEQIGEKGQKTLLSSKVLIAGAGGLGSTVISNLAALGIGCMGIIDNDKLEITNLNRQYIHKEENIGKDKVCSAEEWLSSFNKDIQVNKYKLRLNSTNSEEIIKNYDIVIDCFDSYKSKFELNDSCIKQDKPLVHGGVMEFSGQVMSILPNKSACLRCLFPQTDDNAYITKGIVSPTVSVIASIQAMEVLKILLSIETPLMNKLLTYNALNQDFKKINISRNTFCPVCR